MAGAAAAALGLALTAHDRARAEQSPVAAGPAAPKPQVPQEAARITPAELKPLVEKGGAVLIDTRSAADFERRHAEGALNIPVSSLEARLKDLPKDKLIAAYCT